MILSQVMALGLVLTSRYKQNALKPPLIVWHHSAEAESAGAWAYSRLLQCNVCEQWAAVPREDSALQIEFAQHSGEWKSEEGQ